MTPDPILKVLSTMRRHDVRCLLMGGQACVFYGAAEFSRDADFALLAEPDNLTRLRGALDELQAETIAVPPFEAAYLLKGHAVHFRCRHPDAAGMRVDIMSVMRGVEDFPVLWSRRCTVEVRPGDQYEIMSLRDLVQAKKTQSDKDWPMIRRLIEADYASRREAPEIEDVRLWFMEARTPELLIELAARYPAVLRDVRAQRGLLMILPQTSEREIDHLLTEEQSREREIDRAYWQPLRAELASLRHPRRSA